MKSNFSSQNSISKLDQRRFLRRMSDYILFSQQKSLLEASKIMNETLDLDRLLKLIMDLATKNLDAQRSTLYLVDQDREEIWSRVLQGDEKLNIRLPLGKGLAGYVAKTGETINIKDACKDDRFYKGVDEKTGFVTKSVLCVPMRNRADKIIGSLQVLNKRGAFFSEDDKRFLEAMSDHAALAIENALLYKEALERRHLED